MKRLWSVMVLLCVWTEVVAHNEPSSALASLELRVSADEAELTGDAQTFTGRVKVEVLSEDGQVVLMVRADRAEKRDQELLVQQNVQLETPRGVTGAGLDSLLEAHGLTLSETLIEAQSVHFHAGQRRIEILQFDAEAVDEHESRNPRFMLQADRVVLVLDDDGVWRSRMTKPRAGLRFD